MKYAADSRVMKNVDNYTINNIGIPSLVLMERAALSVAKIIKKDIRPDKKVLCVCGVGNNGADGVAVARILTQWGYVADVMIIGDKNKATIELVTQLDIARKSGVKISSTRRIEEYDIVVDAIFGIGLSRDVGEPYADVIGRINEAHKKVIAVDIPSGICGTTGRVLNVAVKADITVTFGAYKNGQLLGKGPEYCGKIYVKDAGFVNKSFVAAKVKGRVFEKSDLSKIPARKDMGNKGTFGKVLIIAGSKNISGAACLSAESAYRTGSGLVKVITHAQTAMVLKKNVPEALVATYDDNSTDSAIYDLIRENLEWCDVAVIGPGIGTDRLAALITETVFDNAVCPVIADADALNIIAQNTDIIRKRKTQTLVVTPHMGEMSRLTKRKVSDLKEAAVDAALAFAKKYKCVCVMKDARTVVANSDGGYYINMSGNSGMAKGGSGDVLTGVIAGFVVGNRAA
ncbi:MAG: NAD(P)H-hydrate dehydratase, partial [Lachnospiraceae bacterium]